MRTSVDAGHERALWLFLVLASGFLVFVGTSRYGLGLSPDSLSYLAGADGLNRGRGFVDRHDHPIGLWPPLFPATLALLAWLPLASGTVQAAMQALLLAACAGLVWRNCRAVDPIAAALAAGVTLCSLPLLKVGVMLWSELIFACLSLVAIAATVRACGESDRGLPWAAIAAAALAALTRYPGVATIAACALLLWHHRGFVLALVFGVIASLPLALWIVRNLVVVGNPAGTRGGSSAALSDVLAHLPAALAFAFLPAASLPWLLAIAVAATAAALTALRDERSSPPRERRLREGCLLFAAIYLVVMIAGSLGTDLEVISLRYLAPIVPFVVTVVVLSLAAAKSAAARAARWTFLAVWAAFTLSTAFQIESIWASEGAGDFSTDAWKLSPTLQAARDSSPTPRLFSNVPDFLGYELGRVVETMPVRDTPSEELRRRFAENDVVVWFQNGFRSYQIDPTALAGSVPLEVRAELADGMIFRVGKHGPE